ncbi:SDR family oxidoreductase [Nocardia sp. NBC_01388]|uniref:SDR family oxidoreductase n=1 Tax=Nocardia sp. NBC_01388 TaxID=2903596 RepID=UPI0032465B29
MARTGDAMNGRVAIVTGAGRGIGAATVLQLAEAGWSVLAVDLGISDPDLPYPLSTAAELDAVVAEANRRSVEAHRESRRAVESLSGAESRGRRAKQHSHRAVRSLTGVFRPKLYAHAGKRVRDVSAPRDLLFAEPGESAAEQLGSPLAQVESSADQEHAVRAWFADVRDPTALIEAVAFAEAEWGGLDAAVAAAGVIAGGVPLWEMPVVQERAVLDVCLGGVVNLARAAVPALLRRPEPRSGRFLAVASAAATKGLPMLAVYCAAKAGVTGLVRSLGVELGGTGVTANAVSPGSTDTALLTETARLYGLADAKGFAAQQPIGRLLDAAEIAAVLVFLAGPGGNAVMGTTLAVDGGLAL